jgi:hypothetical protein
MQSILPACDMSGLSQIGRRRSGGQPSTLIRGYWQTTPSPSFYARRLTKSRGYRNFSIMVMDKSKTVVTFKHPRISRADQERLGRAYFKDVEPHVLHVGVLPKLAIDVARASREGDVIWLYGLSMVCASRKEAEVIGPAQITLFVKAVAANQAMIVEGATGRSTANKKQCSAMIEEAHVIVGRSGKRLPRTGKGPGRNRKFWPSAEVETAALKMWKSKNIRSDAAAVREIMERFSDLVNDKGKPLVTERLIRTLGNSGRPKP